MRLQFVFQEKLFARAYQWIFSYNLYLYVLNMQNHLIFTYYNCCFGQNFRNLFLNLLRQKHIRGAARTRWSWRHHFLFSFISFSCVVWFSSVLDWKLIHRIKGHLARDSFYSLEDESQGKSTIYFAMYFSDCRDICVKSACVENAAFW